MIPLEITLGFHGFAPHHVYAIIVELICLIARGLARGMWILVPRVCENSCYAPVSHFSTNGTIPSSSQAYSPLMMVFDRR